MSKKNAVIKLCSLQVSLALLLAACGGGGGEQANSVEQEGGKQGKPTQISILSSFYSQEPPSEDNPIIKEIEKRTNTKLNIAWTSSNNYTDKLNVTLASGELPDLILTTDPLNSSVIKGMAAQGAFWDLTNLYKNYPNLAKFPEETWKNLAYADGHNYGIPRVRPVYGQNGLSIRRDWLDKLGLKMPTNMDELYEAMKAFTNNDPDGNGKNDTYGVILNIRAFENVFNKTIGDWKVQDGKLVPTVYLSTEKDALMYANKLYKEKLIPEDFLMLKPSQILDMLKAGKAGVATQAIDQVWNITAELRKQKPDAYMEPIVSLNGVSETEIGSFGMFLIPKTVPEAKLKKIMEFMDYGASAEGSDLANFGFKDVHFIEKDGFKIPTEQAVKDNVSQQAFGQIFLSYIKYLKAYVPGIPKEYYDRHVKIMDERAKNAVNDPSVGVDSEAWIKFWPEYNKKITDMKLHVIMGKEPIEKWDAFVNQLKTEPNFTKIVQEMSESYVKRNSTKK
ncbi:extracellular solute-binding protein [Paenibacillus sp. NPDC056579]|uniref:extracellular solute-binding protein n=1 Tax=Paenibacillus sp. NPDC056579 TaxID=3345871 RepID=UPI003686C16D